MKIKIIVACQYDYGIGYKGELLYRLKEDMANFKRMTTDNIVLMGRKTFESIGSRPLPNRINVVISKTLGQSRNDGVIVFDNFDTAIGRLAEQYKDSGKDVFIIGGAEIYKQALDNRAVDEVIMTRVMSHKKADTFFPRMDFNEWHMELLGMHKEGGIGYYIFHLARKFENFTDTPLFLKTGHYL